MKTKTNNTQSQIRYTLGLIQKHDKPLFLFIFLNTIVLALSPVITLIFPRLLVQELSLGSPFSYILQLFILFFILALLTGYLGSALKGLFFPRPVKVAHPYKLALYKACMVCDYKETTDPSFLNKMQTANKAFAGSFSGIEGMCHKLFSLPGEVFAFGIFVVVMGNLNIFILALLGFSLFINSYLLSLQNKYKHSKKDALSQNEREYTYFNGLMHNFEYGKEIRLNGISTFLHDKFLTAVSHKLATLSKIENNKLGLSLLNLLFVLIRDVIVFGYLIYSVVYHNLSIADFTMYLFAVLGFNASFNSLSNSFSGLESLSLEVKDYRDFMALSSDDDSKAANHFTPLPKAPYTLELKNVSFKYPFAEEDTLKNITIAFDPLEKIAILGENGSGKSTLIKVLLGLYEVTGGEILLNGININKFDKTEYFSLFSAVFQEVLPLAFSLKENIALSTSDEVIPRVEAVIKNVGLDKKVESLPYGLETCVQKFMDDCGIDFSGGEKQKLMIARGLYKDGEVVMLDEPTAALDPLSERDIYHNLNDMTSHKLSFFISHRLASTKFCDRIILMGHGGILEEGTHEQLLQKGQVYKEMWEIQSHYYKEEGASNENYN